MGDTYTELEHTVCSGLCTICREHQTLHVSLTVNNVFSLKIYWCLYMGGISQDMILWGFLTIYIYVALVKIPMCFEQLEANHIMSKDS